MKRRSSGTRRRVEPVGADEFARAAREYEQALPKKLRALAHAIERAQAGDVEALVTARALAHRLAGTAGCYGFTVVGELAGDVDAALWPAFSSSGVAAMRAWAEIESVMARLLTAA